jgi:beta-galactosidase
MKHKKRRGFVAALLFAIIAALFAHAPTTITPTVLPKTARLVDSSNNVADYAPTSQRTVFDLGDYSFGATSCTIGIDNLRFNDWRYALNPSGSPQSQPYDDTHWREVYEVPPFTDYAVGSDGPVSVSGSFKDDYEGISWSRDHFCVPSLPSSTESYLEFDASQGVTDVWFGPDDGSTTLSKLTASGSHNGGFSRFRFKTPSGSTVKLQAATKMLLVVKSNNNDTSNNAPRTGDFTRSGGLYRPARIVFVNKAHVSEDDSFAWTPGAGVPSGWGGTSPPFSFSSSGDGLSLDPIVTASCSPYCGATGSATLGGSAKITNDSGSTAYVRLATFDADGSPFGTATAPQSVGTGSSTVLFTPISYSSVNLWYPRNGDETSSSPWSCVPDANGANPCVYWAQVQVCSDSACNTKLDSVTEPVAWRKIVVNAGNATNPGFWVNGHRYQVHGVGMHQFNSAVEDMESAKFPYVDTMYSDFQTAVDMGVNAIRFAHYEHAPSYISDVDGSGATTSTYMNGPYDLADQDGILVWSEIPNIDSIPDTSTTAGNSSWDLSTESQMVELIRQTQMHPSVFAYGVGNENWRCDSSYNDPSGLASALNDIVHQMDIDSTNNPHYSTMASAWENLDSTATISGSAEGVGANDQPLQKTDLVGFNRYDGWYETPTNLHNPADSACNSHPPTQYTSTTQTTGDTSVTVSGSLREMLNAYENGDSSSVGGTLGTEYTTAKKNTLRMAVSEYGYAANPWVHQQAIDPTTTAVLASQSDQSRENLRSEESQLAFHQETWPVIDQINGNNSNNHYVWGSFVWNMFDFPSDKRQEGLQAGQNDKGLVTADGTIKKDAYYYYAANWLPATVAGDQPFQDNPVVHINSKRRYMFSASDPFSISIETNFPWVHIKRATGACTSYSSWNNGGGTDKGSNGLYKLDSADNYANQSADGYHSILLHLAGSAPGLSTSGATCFKVIGNATGAVSGDSTTVDIATWYPGSDTAATPFTVDSGCSSSCAGADLADTTVNCLQNGSCTGANEGYAVPDCGCMDSDSVRGTLTSTDSIMDGATTLSDPALSEMRTYDYGGQVTYVIPVVATGSSVYHLTAKFYEPDGYADVGVRLFKMAVNGQECDPDGSGTTYHAGDHIDINLMAGGQDKELDITCDTPPLYPVDGVSGDPGYITVKMQRSTWFDDNWSGVLSALTVSS